MLFVFCVKKKSKNRFHDDGKKGDFSSWEAIKTFPFMVIVVVLVVDAIFIMFYLYLFHFWYVTKYQYSINKTSHYCNIHESSSTHNAKCRFSSRQTSYSLQRHKIIFFS